MRHRWLFEPFQELIGDDAPVGGGARFRPKDGRTRAHVVAVAQLPVDRPEHLLGWGERRLPQRPEGDIQAGGNLHRGLARVMALLDLLQADLQQILAQVHHDIGVALAQQQLQPVADLGVVRCDALAVPLVAPARLVADAGDQAAGVAHQLGDTSA